jgi:hypothetical protein
MYIKISVSKLLAMSNDRILEEHLLVPAMHCIGGDQFSVKTFALRDLNKSMN